MRKLFKTSLSLSVLLIVSLLIISCAPADPAVEEVMPVEEEVMPVEEEDIPVEEPAMPMDSEVTMTSNSFQPDQLTVAVGTTVTWVNTNNMAHTVTSGSRGSPTGLFDATLSPGESFSYQFNEAGTFEYNCTFHPGMDGTVIVQ
jgi:plastocyanin